MGIFTITSPWTFTFGLLGNIISIMVFLAPMPTFYKVYKRKSTEGFQSLPYVVALFSSILWVCYAYFKSHAPLLITINAIGCFIETFYIVVFILYAPRNAKILTAKLLVSMNLGAFGLILVPTIFFAKGSNRVKILGGFCFAISIAVFAAPLSIMRRVIRTKSAEYMPFSLSFFLTLSAVLWFVYGLLLKDYYVALPNVLGFIFGVIQMALYYIYKDDKKVIEQENLPEHTINIVRVSTMVHPVDAEPIDIENDVSKEVEEEEEDQKVKNIKVPNEVQLSEFEV